MTSKNSKTERALPPINNPIEPPMSPGNITESGIRKGQSRAQGHNANTIHVATYSTFRKHNEPINKSVTITLMTQYPPHPPNIYLNIENKTLKHINKSNPYAGPRVYNGRFGYTTCETFRFKTFCQRLKIKDDLCFKNLYRSF